MNRKAIVICETTYHGNTMKLAKVMAKRLQTKVVGFDQALSMDLSSYQIIGLGSGIYFQMHHPKLIQIVNQLSNQEVFIFSTHGSPFRGKYHFKLKEALRQNNVTLVGEFDTKGYDNTGPFVIFNGGNKGRPHEGDLLKAKRFVMKLFPNDVLYDKKVTNGEHVQIHEGCIQCKKCMSVCPMGVFHNSNDQVIVSSPNECTHCQLCTDSCPTNSIGLFHTKKDLIKIAIHHKDKIGL